MILKRKILLLLLISLSWAEITPENGANLNFTHVFFKWDQVPSINNYIPINDTKQNQYFENTTTTNTTQNQDTINTNEEDNFFESEDEEYIQPDDISYFLE